MPLSTSFHPLSWYNPNKNSRSLTNLVSVERYCFIRMNNRFWSGDYGLWKTSQFFLLWQQSKSNDRHGRFQIVLFVLLLLVLNYRFPPNSYECFSFLLLTNQLKNVLIINQFARKTCTRMSIQNVPENEVSNSYTCVLSNFHTFVMSAQPFKIIWGVILE